MLAQSNVDAHGPRVALALGENQSTSVLAARLSRSARQVALARLFAGLEHELEHEPEPESPEPDSPAEPFEVMRHG